MNRAQIIAELRRSAIEDQRPWIGVRRRAWKTALNTLTGRDCRYEHSSETVAVFFLIVAEAMEQE